MRLHVKTFFILAAFLLVTSMAWAAEAVGPSVVVEGTLSAVYSDFITVDVPPGTINSPDANRLSGEEFAFQITLDTRYDNVTKLTDLLKGDRVRVEYQPQDKGKDLAVLITRLPPLDVVVPVGSEKTTTTTTVTTTSYPVPVHQVTVEQ